MQKYEILLERVKNVHVNKEGKQHEQETDEMPEAF